MRKPSFYPEKGYITKRSWFYHQVNIPKGHVKCKVCNGTGEVRVYYGSPGDRGQFQNCINCGGLGYISIELVEADKRLNADLIMSRFGKAFDIIFPSSEEKAEENDNDR